MTLCATKTFNYCNLSLQKNWMTEESMGLHRKGGINQKSNGISDGKSVKSHGVFKVWILLWNNILTSLAIQMICLLSSHWATTKSTFHKFSPILFLLSLSYLVCMRELRRSWKLNWHLKETVPTSWLERYNINHVSNQRHISVYPHEKYILTYLNVFTF